MENLALWATILGVPIGLVGLYLGWRGLTGGKTRRNRESVTSSEKVKITRSDGDNRTKIHDSTDVTIK